jgi:hypothetical protein
VQLVTGGMCLCTLGMRKSAVHLPETQGQQRRQPMPQKYIHMTCCDSAFVVFTHSAPRSQSDARFQMQTRFPQALKRRDRVVHGCCSVTEIIFPRIYARMYYAPPRARVMSFSTATLGPNCNPQSTGNPGSLSVPGCPPHAPSM